MEEKMGKHMEGRRGNRGKDGKIGEGESEVKERIGD